MTLVVPGDQGPAGELDAVDVPALAAVEDRDAGVGVHDAVEAEQVLRAELVAVHGRAQEPVKEAPVSDAQDALRAWRQPLLHAVDAAEDVVERLRARL